MPSEAVRVRVVILWAKLTINVRWCNKNKTSGTHHAMKANFRANCGRRVLATIFLSCAILRDAAPRQLLLRCSTSCIPAVVRFLRPRRTVHTPGHLLDQYLVSPCPEHKKNRYRSGFFLTMPWIVYLILASLYITCLRTTGSYFFISIFPGVFFLFLSVV